MKVEILSFNKEDKRMNDKFLKLLEQSTITFHSDLKNARLLIGNTIHYFNLADCKEPKSEEKKLKSD